MKKIVVFLTAIILLQAGSTFAQEDALIYEDDGAYPVQASLYPTLQLVPYDRSPPNSSPKKAPASCLKPASATSRQRKKFSKPTATPAPTLRRNAHFVLRSQRFQCLENLK